MTIIDLSYHCHHTESVAEVLAWHAASSGYARHLKDNAKIVMIKHLQHVGPLEHEGVSYQFFRRPNRFWQIPFVTHRFVRQQRPDVVLVQGLVFPLQVLALRAKLGNRVRIVAQHHGDRPWGGLKGWLQRLADRYIDAYTFTSLGNATPWVQKGIIAHIGKCYRVLEAVPAIQPIDKAVARQQTGMEGSFNFLWVGRLTAFKDPLTVLAAFSQYLGHNPAARLYMVYQTNDLLPEVKAMLANDERLEKAVRLLGRLHQTALATWYSAADFFIAASHREGSGYALLEAMQCGCVPVLSRIPSFETITDQGQQGVLFQTGNAADLLAQLQRLDQLVIPAMSAGVKNYAATHFTHGAIAGQIWQLCQSLCSVVD
jgi:glycosyltransferase involved in cell wall biosynthesis